MYRKEHIPGSVLKHLVFVLVVAQVVAVVTVAVVVVFVASVVVVRETAREPGHSEASTASRGFGSAHRKPRHREAGQTR